MFKQNKWNNKIYCDKCKKYQPIEIKVIYCIDCGKEVTVDSRDNQTVRCNECQHIKDKKSQNQRYKKWYYSHKPNANKSNTIY